MRLTTTTTLATAVLLGMSGCNRPCQDRILEVEWYLSGDVRIQSQTGGITGDGRLRGRFVHDSAGQFEPGQRVCRQNQSLMGNTYQPMPTLPCQGCLLATTFTPSPRDRPNFLYTRFCEPETREARWQAMLVSLGLRDVGDDGEGTLVRFFPAQGDNPNTPEDEYEPPRWEVVGDGWGKATPIDDPTGVRDYRFEFRLPIGYRSHWREPCEEEPEEEPTYGLARWILRGDAETAPATQDLPSYRGTSSLSFEVEEGRARRFDPDHVLCRYVWPSREDAEHIRPDLPCEGCTFSLYVDHPSEPSRFDDDQYCRLAPFTTVERNPGVLNMGLGHHADPLGTGSMLMYYFPSIIYKPDMTYYGTHRWDAVGPATFDEESGAFEWEWEGGLQYYP